MNKEDLFNEMRIIINKFVDGQDKRLEKYKETHDYILNIPFVQNIVRENEILKGILKSIGKNKDVDENITIEITEKPDVIDLTQEEEIKPPVYY